MAVTLKCADCGYSAQSEDESPRTCPQCEGTMKKPAYKAKIGTTSSDREKPKAKADDSKSRPAGRPAASAKPAAQPAAAKEANPFTADDAEDEPKPKKKPRDEDERPKKKPTARPAKKEEPLSLDDEEPEKGAGGNTRDDAAAKSLDIDPGFSNKKLMRQVEEELSRGEVLHWAGRMCPEIAEKGVRTVRTVGIVFAAVGALFAVIGFAAAPWFVGVILLLFPAIGTAIAIIGPKVSRKKAELGWYAVTNQRAIVFIPSAFGSGGEAKTYEPDELRRMRVKKSVVVDGAGDLIFKTTVHERRTDYVDRNTGQTLRSETNRHELHEGFLGIENVREVETLVHNVLLGGTEDD